MQCEHLTIRHTFISCLEVGILTAKSLLKECPFLPIFHTSRGVTSGFIINQTYQIPKCNANILPYATFYTLFRGVELHKKIIIARKIHFYPIFLHQLNSLPVLKLAVLYPISLFCHENDLEIYS